MPIGLWSRKAKTASERNIHTFKHSRPHHSLCHLGSLAPEAKGQYIHTYEQSLEGHRMDQSIGGTLLWKAFIWEDIQCTQYLQYSQWLLKELVWEMYNIIRFSVIYEITIKINNYFKWEQEVPASKHNKHSLESLRPTWNASWSHIKAL